MKMFVFKGKASNFGDDLNRWLWPKILPDFFDEDDSTLFLGIGSILYDNHSLKAKKIVFGSGYAGYSKLPTIDDAWKIYFVRGAKTAEVLGLPKETAVGDSGILIRTVDLPEYPKIHNVSFMPHFETATYGSWQIICRKLGINFIDPRWDVDRVLENMLSSKLMVSEAMHGIIIADALRVPWQAIRPLDPNHHAKWHDWASVLNVTIDFADLGPSNLLEWIMSRFWTRRRIVYALRKRRDSVFPIAGIPFGSAGRALQVASRSAGQLSADTDIERVTAQMLAKVKELKHDFARGS